MNLRTLRHLRWVALPLIVVPMFAVHSAEEPPPGPDGVVTMGHEEFNTEHVQLRTGQYLQVRNDSNWLHVLVHGEGAVTRPEPGSPVLGPDEALVVQRGDALQIGPWRHVGVYHVTCQLHPEMNLTVRVVASAPAPGKPEGR